MKAIVFLVFLCFLLIGCKDEEGVCTGYSSTFNKTYCYDGWTASECSEYDKEEVNGANWNFFEGQTCAQRGE